MGLWLPSAQEVNSVCVFSTPNAADPSLLQISISWAIKRGKCVHPCIHLCLSPSPLTSLDHENPRSPQAEAMLFKEGS